ncbi:tetratricopeptide repeat protein [Luteolibacter yonseiensis]|uniref:Tetratricopeptide repeat protein n=1 Tax=Luteolibacter yonseiensis TaxID=1144680 RepID=A0A934R1K8_9BACT|nr:tetratricopeptide repeat protein [Luteolibacter yonseiensis]MBK1814651.1 tetratricopeptide repeat protein [Luteolibacter yonseiensis]
MDSPTATLIGILQDRVESLRDAGNLNEALHAASAAVEKTQQSLGPDLDSIDAFASALEIRGDIQRELGKFEEARDDYRQAIDQLQDRPDRFDQVGRLHAALGAAYDGLGIEARAVNHWQKAIEFFEKNDPPLLLDIATISNNLGFITKANGDLDTAESHFLRALEISHSQLGQEHEQTATVSSNLGALYQAAGFHEQSREMHMIALETRRNLLGEEHPDTAQSHNNLALALLNTGDRSWARRHFEKSLSGYEALGPEYADDLEAVAGNYCDFLREEGEAQLADVIAGRVREVLGTAVA